LEAFSKTIAAFWEQVNIIIGKSVSERALTPFFKVEITLPSIKLHFTTGVLISPQPDPGSSGVPRGVWGGSIPPPEIPKAFQNRAKLNPIVKTVKNC